MWSIKSSRKPAAKLCGYTFLFFGVVFGLSGCFPIYQKQCPSPEAPMVTTAPSIENAPTIKPFTDVLEASYAAADHLCDGLKRKKIQPNATILAASFVDVNHLEKSSTFGRIISEQISSRIAQNGFEVLDMKLRHDSVYMKKGQGEFLLSREVSKVSKMYNGEFVLVGTYAVAEMSVYVSARIVDTSDNVITTGYDFQIGRNFQTDSLLN